MWKEDREGLQELIRNFFQELYKKESKVNPHELLNLVKRTMKDDMNRALTKAFSAEEISNSLFQIGPLKAHGPDGFPAHFYQQN